MARTEAAEDQAGGEPFRPCVHVSMLFHHGSKAAKPVTAAVLPRHDGHPAADNDMPVNQERRLPHHFSLWQASPLLLPHSPLCNLSRLVHGFCPTGVHELLGGCPLTLRQTTRTACRARPFRSGMQLGRHHTLTSPPASAPGKAQPAVRWSRRQQWPPTSLQPSEPTLAAAGSSRRPFCKLWLKAAARASTAGRTSLVLLLTSLQRLAKQQGRAVCRSAKQPPPLAHSHSDQQSWECLHDSRLPASLRLQMSTLLSQRPRLVQQRPRLLGQAAQRCLQQLLLSRL